MDQIRDYENFKRLVMRVSTTFDKFATDELIESWWKALRTESFQHLERRIDQFIAGATEKTKFPRPGQFRSEANAVVSDADTARDKHIAEANKRNWREFIDRYPVTGPIKMKLALCSQILAKEPDHSPAYAEAIDEERHLLSQLGEHGRFCADR